jgi:phage anti-repressor protein
MNITIRRCRKTTKKLSDNNKDHLLNINSMNTMEIKEKEKPQRRKKTMFLRCHSSINNNNNK